MSLKRGFALITVLAMVIVISLGAATLLRSMGNVANLKSNSIADIQAQYLTEAGVEYAKWLCRNAACPASTGNTITIDGAAVKIAATALTPANFYNITASVAYTEL